MKINRKINGSKRLSKEKWEEIRKLLDKGDRNISWIARKYKINRRSIYAYCWRHNIFQKKKKSFVKRAILWLKRGGK